MTIHKMTLIAAVGLTTIAIIGIYAFYAFNSDYFGSPTPDGFGNFGSYIGGTAGALFGIISAFLLYSTYRTQSEQLALTRQEVEFGIAQGHIPNLQKVIEEEFDKNFIMWGSKGKISSPDSTKALFKNYPGTRYLNTASLLQYLPINAEIEEISQINSLDDLQCNLAYSDANRDAAALFIERTAMAINNYDNHFLNEPVAKYLSSLVKKVLCVYEITFRLYEQIGVLPIYLTNYIEWLENFLPPLRMIYQKAASNTVVTETLDISKRLRNAQKNISKWTFD